MVCCQDMITISTNLVKSLGQGKLGHIRRDSLNGTSSEPEPEPSPTNEPDPIPTKPTNGTTLVFNASTNIQFILTYYPRHPPDPIQPGLVSNCNKFYFVKKDDDCSSVASKHGITLAQFTKWNAGTRSNWAGLWADAYACVSIIGLEPSPTKPTPPTVSRRRHQFRRA